MGDWKLWLKGLISAAVSGVVGAVGVVIVDPLTFNLQTGFTKLWQVAIICAIVGVANYLKQSPLPNGTVK